MEGLFIDSKSSCVHLNILVSFWIGAERVCPILIAIVFYTYACTNPHLGNVRAVLQRKTQSMVVWLRIYLSSCWYICNALEVCPKAFTSETFSKFKYTPPTHTHFLLLLSWVCCGPALRPKECNSWVPDILCEKPAGELAEPFPLPFLSERCCPDRRRRAVHPCQTALLTWVHSASSHD